MPLAFMVPPGNSPGKRYTHRLAEALRALGHDAQISPKPLPGSVPVLDGALLPCPIPPGAVALLHREPDGDWRPSAFRLLIASSPAVLERLDESGSRAVLVAPGADVLPRSPGSGGPQCAILAVGALTARKGYENLLRALARLADLDWRLTIAGGTAQAPDHADSIATLAGELGLGERVRLIRDSDDPALGALWRGADLFALATEWEAYPAALAEALRRGIPAAVTDVAAAGLPPLAGSGQGAKWGVTCAVGDVEGFSKALRRLIYDRDLRASLADAAWQAGQALPGWDAQARRFVAVLEDVREDAG